MRRAVAGWRNVVLRVIAAWMCALVALSAQAADADISFTVQNPVQGLLSQGAGKKSIRLAIDGNQALTGTHLALSLRGYQEDGVPVLTPIASWRQMVGSVLLSAVVTVQADLPAVGFYQLDVQLLSPNGATLARRQINLAALPHRTTLGPADFGVGANFDQGDNAPATLLSIIKSAGFSWIRGELTWDTIEKKPGVFMFPAQFDESMKLAHEMGLTTLVLLDYGNPVAYPELFKEKLSFPMTAAARDAFARYADAMVKRYKGKVNYWEVWNEPRLILIGYSPYVELLKRVYPVIKQADRQAGVIACGGEWGGVPVDACFNAIRAAGAIDYNDGFSIHPYMYPAAPEVGFDGDKSPVKPVSMMTIWPYLSGLTAKNRPSDGRRLQVWVTEIGWPSAPVSKQQNETKQAAYFLRTYLLTRRFNTARGVCWYDLVDDGTDPDDRENNFGLVRADLSPKPAFAAAAVWSATLGDRAWSKAWVDSADIKVYQYGGGTGNDSPVISGWSVAKRDSVHLALPAGDYVQRNWDGRETAVTVADKGLDWPVGPLPRYLLPKQPQQPGHQDQEQKHRPALMSEENRR